LVFYGTSTQDRSICANLPGGLLAQAFEDNNNIFLYSARITLKSFHKRDIRKDAVLMYYIYAIVFLFDLHWAYN